MIEVLRILSQSDQPLEHSIIFNFNGAEETVLQVCTLMTCCDFFLHGIFTIMVKLLV